MIDRAMGAFLEACGSRGPLVIGVDEPGASAASWRLLDQPFAVVGRDPGSDLHLNDPAASRRHAYFQAIAGRLFCVDLQGGRGTHWGDEPGLWGWVHPGPGVRIGSSRFRPRGGAGGPDETAAGGDEALPVSRSSGQPALPETTLEILGGAPGPATWRASRSLVLIGQSPACKVRLPGSGVSKVHASLLRTPAGVFVVDLLAPGGILVNGERVRYARLGREDELTVGDHTIRARCGPPAGGDSRALRRSPDRPASSPPAPVPARPSGIASGESPALPGGGDDARSLARAMLDEFGRIQGQAAERSQGTLMAVLQSFAGIHREQMTLIREELAYIRRLTEEQQALRSRIDRGAASPPALRLVSGEARAAAAGHLPDVAAPPGPGIPPRKLTIKGDPDRPPGAGRPRPGVPGADGDGEFHARLFDRLAEIQGERQGRWRRIMESMLGKGP